MANSSDAKTTLDALGRTEMIQAANAALVALPQEEREAIGFCCQMDMTLREASEILGVSESTLNDRMKRGLERLRVRLTTLGFASATPLLIGEHLKLAGMPAAPQGLAKAIGSLIAGHQAAATAGGVAYKSAAGKALLGSSAASAKMLGLMAALALVGGGLAYSWLPAQVPQDSANVPAKTAGSNAGDESSIVHSVPVEKVSSNLVFFHDMEEGMRPDFLRDGNVVPGPDRLGNRYCIQALLKHDRGMIKQEVWFEKFDKKNETLFAYEPGMKLSLDFWVEGETDRLGVGVWSSQQNSNFWTGVDDPPKGKWTRITLNLDDFRPQDHPEGKGLQPSADIFNLIFGTIGGQNDRLYVDNIELRRPAPAAHPQAGGTGQSGRKSGQRDTQEEKQ